MDDQLKECTKCLDFLPLSMFSKQKSTKDGRKYTCKKCNAGLASKRYADHKEEHIRKVNKWQIENYDKVKKYKTDWANKAKE